MTNTQQKSSSENSYFSEEVTEKSLKEEAARSRPASTTTTSPSDLLTTREVADFLRLKPDTVREWLRAGRIAGFKVGDQGWRIHRSEVLRHLQDGLERGKPRRAE